MTFSITLAVVTATRTVVSESEHMCPFLLHRIISPHGQGKPSPLRRVLAVLDQVACNEGCPFLCPWRALHVGGGALSAICCDKPTWRPGYLTHSKTSSLRDMLLHPGKCHPSHFFFLSLASLFDRRTGGTTSSAFLKLGVRMARSICAREAMVRSLPLPADRPNFLSVLCRSCSRLYMRLLRRGTFGPAPDDSR